MPQASERVNGLGLQPGDISIGVQRSQVLADMLSQVRSTHLRRQIYLLHTIQKSVHITHM